MSPPGFYNPSLALADFQSALGHCGWPVYPQRSWWHCLARAEELDDLRKRTATQLAIDATEYYAAHVTYVDRFYVSSTVPRMNGRPLRLVVVEPEYP